MVASERELVADFAEAVHVGDATIFVGAGLSQGAGLPGWNGLISGARASAHVPEELDDAPLAAEYISLVLGTGWLDGEIRRVIDVNVVPTAIHQKLADLPVRDYWTTNYDNLIEAALEARHPGHQRVVGEADYGQSAASGSRVKRITKMHGSLNLGVPAARQWQQPPVITRSDFETYEQKRPITWARLRATWLTNSMLFLGFSFDDPNLNLLLRLSRSLPFGVDAPRHFAVFAKKNEPLEQRLQELRIIDLERSGVVVHEIDAYEDLLPLVSRLEVRCRGPVLFASGSFKQEGEQARHIAEAIGVNLTAMPDADFTVVSFGGDAGQVISKTYRDALDQSDYRPDRIRFYYRKAKPGSSEKIPVEHRVGMAIFTELELDKMRQQVFPTVRAMVVVGGGERTRAEVELVRGQGVPVIPVAASGGLALDLWAESSPEQLGLDMRNAENLWEKLNSAQIPLAASAASDLIRSAMFG